MYFLRVFFTELKAQVISFDLLSVF
jgi:hypothetical protein